MICPECGLETDEPHVAHLVLTAWLECCYPGQVAVWGNIDEPNPQEEPVSQKPSL